MKGKINKVLPRSIEILELAEAGADPEEVLPCLGPRGAKIATDNLKARIKGAGGVEEFVRLGEETLGRFLKRG